MEMKFPS